MRASPEARQADRDVRQVDIHRIALETDLFALRAVMPQDEPWCLSMLEQAARTGSLRLNIPTFGPKEVEAELWFKVLAQFIAWDKPNGFPVALISIYDVAGSQSVASVHATLEPALATLDVCAEILPLFVQYVFNCWPFRKIYIRYASGAPELDRWHAVFQSDGDRCGSAVGVQVDQLNVAGEYSDVETYELTRERWEAAARRSGIAADPGPSPPTEAQRASQFAPRRTLADERTASDAMMMPASARRFTQTSPLMVTPTVMRCVASVSHAGAP